MFQPFVLQYCKVCLCHMLLTISLGSRTVKNSPLCSILCNCYLCRCFFQIRFNFAQPSHFQSSICFPQLLIPLLDALYCVCSFSCYVQTRLKVFCAAIIWFLLFLVTVWKILHTFLTNCIRTHSDDFTQVHLRSLILVQDVLMKCATIRRANKPEEWAYTQVKLDVYITTKQDHIH